MHIYSLKREKIELDFVETDFASRLGAAPAMSLRGGDPVSATRLTRAALAFFEYGRRSGNIALAESAKHPPTVVRERESGRFRTFGREVVIRFRPKTSMKTRKDILAKWGFKTRRSNGFVRDQVVVFDEGRKYVSAKLVEAAASCAELDEVVFATPNFVSEYSRNAVPIPHAEQWHLDNKGKGGQKKGEDVRALQAWAITKGKAAIVVAVLDDGVDVDHPNLKSRIAPGGRDFFVEDTHPEHQNPRPKIFRFPFHQMAGNDIHGTPCAGVIGAPGRNKGAVGIAPGCRILPIKIFHADDLAADERVADAIRYAASHADILSCSWSGGFSPDVEQAIEDAGQLGRAGKGSAVFCATGNDSRGAVAFPARNPDAIAVGASTDGGQRASYSNFGPQVSIVAPSNGGVKGIFTTDVGIASRGFNVGIATAGGVDGLHTNTFGGTSSATPLAAGVGALVLSVKPSLDRAALKQILEQSADRIGADHAPNGHSPTVGFGRVNAAKALELAKKP
ncbi:MAG: S8 family serine peptidase [Bryobacterales bacterium]|nr:S8 family serine peptidase [Bryobacterales bacterium]